MLNFYISATQQLLQNPQAGNALYATSNITGWINLAHSQLAGENQCIRYYGTLDLPTASRVANFTSINTGASATNGIQGVFNLKQVSLQIGSGAAFIRARSFPWFTQYHLMQIVQILGPPKVYAQYSQGVNGSIYVDPIPDQEYTLNVDCVCYPIPLVDDTTVEAIPYPWTDCVPFFAAWYAYMGAQRQADADLMYKRYQIYADRARSMSNPDVLTHLYPQAQDVTLQNKLGIDPRKQGGGG